MHFPTGFSRDSPEKETNLEDKGVREHQGTQQLSHLPHTEEKPENTQQYEHLRVHQPEDTNPMKINSLRDPREF